MRIAQVAPLYESVPPKLYGGTERVVSYLTEELVRLGHDVTLFASGDSMTEARLIAPCATSLRLDKSCVDKMAYHVLLLDQVYSHAKQFDIVHFHIDYLHYPASARLGIPRLTTLHGRLDLPELRPLYHHFDDEPVVSISNAQRSPLEWIDWLGTVYHGLPKDLLRFEPSPGKYLAFLGRISVEKRADRAIEIANRSGMELRIAAKVDEADREYYETVIRPLLDRPGVEYIGEISEDEKSAFLGNAAALLFPIDWPEPFGLVMIESLACGTPVIAWRGGSVPEVLTDGETGFVCDSVEECIQAVKRIPEISRYRCREIFERRFSASRMAMDYLNIYHQIVASTQNYESCSPWKRSSRSRSSFTS
jgi:glycosyltransferase involved in cell wall biosynthesis